MRNAPRGAVTLVFDDGYRAVYDHVLPLLRRYGFRAVFAVPLNTEALERTEGAPVSSLDAWRSACATDGHELAAHGVTHQALTRLSNTELTGEIAAAHDATQAVSLVYPGGAHDDRVVAATRQLFRAARTVLRGYESFPPRDPHRLRSFVSTRENFVVWRWNLRALWAWLTNRWLIETHHNVSFGQGAWATGHGKRHTIPLDALERHIRFVVSLPLRVTTIRDMVQAPKSAGTSEARFGSV